MSSLTRYPVPQAGAAGKVNAPQLHFRLEPTIVPGPVLDFLRPLRATEQGIPAGEVEAPRLHFRLEPTIVPGPVLDFLRPLRGLEAIKASTVDNPRLYFRLGAAVVGAGETGNFANFDGANDYLTRGANFTGIADGDKGLFSVWIKIPPSGSTQRILSADTAVAARAVIIPAGNARIIFDNAASNTILELRTAVSGLDDNIVHHILFAWDLAAGFAEAYVDDVSSTNAITVTADTIDFVSHGDWAVGAGTDGGSKINGCIADLYFNTVATLDITVEANRRKFIDANGDPVDLGADGSLPTGTAPILALDQEFSTWHQNNGTGGGLTVTGELTACPSVVPRLALLGVGI